MKRAALLMGAWLALVYVVQSAYAGDRDLNQTQYIQKLNGSPRFLGVIGSSDGGCFNNWTNQVLWDAGIMTDGGVATDTTVGTNVAAFAMSGGQTVKFQCPFDARYSPGWGTGTTATSRQSLRISGNITPNGYFIGLPETVTLSNDENAISVCPLDAGTNTLPCTFHWMR